MTNDTTRSQTVVDDAVETISRIADFDRETARDKYHFSIWVAALATAGLGFLLTKGLDLVANMPQLKGWIVAAAIGLAFTLALSAIVQSRVGTFREAIQTIKALYLAQRLRIIVVPENISVIMRTPESQYELTGQLLDGKFIPEDERDSWEGLHRRRDRAERVYLWALRMQWPLVFVCYVVVFIVAFW